MECLRCFVITASLVSECTETAEHAKKCPVISSRLAMARKITSTIGPSSFSIHHLFKKRGRKKGTGCSLQTSTVSAKLLLL